jgi:hypothetical protein
MKGLQTEFEFSLPRGFVDNDGNVHKNGAMRLATAMDEIAPMRDPRVKQNQAYLTVLLLERVITRLGTLPLVNSAIIERLYSADFAFLQDFYRHINEHGDGTMTITCPSCGHVFDEAFTTTGER